MKTPSKIALLALLLWMPDISHAAPKSPARPRWEFCIVQGNVRTVQGEGIQVSLPQGRQFFLKNSAGKTQIQNEVQVLNRLGNDGWEVVGYANSNASKSWTLKRRK